MASLYPLSLPQEDIDRNVVAQSFQANSLVPPLSYLSARRPSLSVQNEILPSSHSRETLHSNLRNEALLQIDAEEEEAKFRQSLQIDMKTLVGDSIGNVRPPAYSIRTRNLTSL